MNSDLSSAPKEILINNGYNIIKLPHEDDVICGLGAGLLRPEAGMIVCNDSEFAPYK